MLTHGSRIVQSLIIRRGFSRFVDTETARIWPIDVGRIIEPIGGKRVPRLFEVREPTLE